MTRTARTVTGSLTWLVWLILMAGCSDAPTTPSLAPPPPSLQSTLSGVVYEHTSAGVRPLAGVSLDVWWFGRARGGRVTTDAEGRYQAANLPADVVSLNANSPDHLQPCRAAITLAGNGTLDVHLVTAAALKAGGIPQTFSVQQPTLSGRVFERTPDGVRPVPDASLVLDFSGGDGWDPGAQTISESSGQYAFCNITAGAESGVGIWAEKPGYRGTFLLVGRPRDSTTLDVELVRE